MVEECHYCKEENPECLTGGKGFGEDEFAEIKDGYINIEQWVGAFTPDPERLTMSIEINYCPKCGIKLN